MSSKQLAGDSDEEYLEALIGFAALLVDDVQTRPSIECVGRLKMAIIILDFCCLEDCNGTFDQLILFTLGVAHREKFYYTGSGDLPRSISLFRQSLDLTTSSTISRSDTLNELAITLRMHFQQSQNPKDLMEGMELHKAALTNDPGTSSCKSAFWLTSYGDAMKDFFEIAVRLEPANLAIKCYRRSLELSSNESLCHWQTLHELAVTLRLLYNLSSQINHLEEASALEKRALQLATPQHPLQAASLTNLGKIYYRLYERNGNPDFIKQSVTYSRKALSSAYIPHLLRPELQNGLAVSLSIIVEGLGGDIGEVVSLFRATLTLVSCPLRHKLHAEHELGPALRLQFLQNSDISVLDEAIILQRKCMESSSLPRQQFVWIIKLALSLQARFYHFRQPNDLPETIALYEESLKSIPVSHHERPKFLYNLGNVLLVQFETEPEINTLDRAISALREGLNLLKIRIDGDNPIHPLANSLTHLLAHSLNTKGAYLNDSTDLNEIITLFRIVLKNQTYSPLDSDKKSKLLKDFAIALRMQYRSSGIQNDLDEALLLHDEAYNLLTPTSVDRALSAAEIGITMMVAYQKKQLPAYLEDAVSWFRRGVASKAAYLWRQYQAALTWADSVDGLHDSALQAYESAIELLRQFATLNLDLDSRQKILARRSDGLARNAAACAIQLGEFEKAVELLEEGRGIFWSQALHLRTPMDDLRNVDGGLADDLHNIAAELEEASYRSSSVFSMQMTNKEKVSVEEKEVYLRQLNERWTTTVERVRTLSGFQDFLRPLQASKLMKSADEHPVIILNASNSRCDALILTRDGIEHLPLMNFSPGHARRLTKLVQISHNIASGNRDDNDEISKQLQSFDDPLLRDSEGIFYETIIKNRAGKASGTDKLSSDDLLSYILRVLWDHVVKPVLHKLNIQKSEKPSRVYWCPTGPFTFLPLHAAGDYESPDGERAFDYVISSYTPSVATLLSKRKNEHISPVKSFKMMTLIQSKSLPQTRIELEKIKTRVPEQLLTTLGDSPIPVSIDEVLSCLETVSVAHFACHGRQDSLNPLESALILEDSNSELQLSKIMKHPMPNALLAFLCACETAKGLQDLPDEAIHLGSTLLFGGFQSVIATMWSIADIDGPKIADEFYKNLFSKDRVEENSEIELDTSETAWALHRAVAELREENVSFSRWVPYIHLGQ
ncbi:CHAT domain-containing protein [Crucibulum laeve]|uniref:CHAT domain-containing protein n=1 Tax=Crucibulum laeve TaxID=68775 RepID=A0A5C3LLE1_9AGAR|nr:CHAT domain-containing protein [Crucibulum laeve]